MKCFEELFDSSQETWGLIQSWYKNKKNSVEILNPDKSKQENSLVQLQVSTKSTLGAVVFYTGGILINNGWIRILGSGNQKLKRNLLEWNEILDSSNKKIQGAMLIADDVLGGFFAINGGGLNGEAGNIFYLSPDTLEWEDLEVGYTDFINWCFNGDLDMFYNDYHSLKEPAKGLPSDMGFLFYPFLWSDFSDLEKLSRTVVSINELWSLTIENKNKFSEESN